MSNLVKRKLLVMGPAPKALGGVAIHLRRLEDLLKDDFDIFYVDEGRERYDGIFNLRSLNLFRYLKLVFTANVVYINSGSPILRIFHILICKIIFRKKTIVAIHHDIIRESLISLSKFFVKKCDTLLVVNETTEKVFSGSVKNLICFAAFIPPDLDQEPELPELVADWCNKRRKSSDTVIMVSNAWNLVTHNGFDLYGLDLCIEAMRLLVEKGVTNYYLVFVVASNTSNQKMMEGYKHFIQENKLEDYILIWESSLSFVRLIKESDIVLRATNTDGDPLTIREAFCFGKSVIASDVIARPENTLLFKNRDAESLSRTILEATCSKNKSVCNNYSIDYYKKFYMDIFK